MTKMNAFGETMEEIAKVRTISTGSNVFSVLPDDAPGLKGFGEHEFVLYGLDGVVERTKNMWDSNGTKEKIAQTHARIESAYNPSEDIMIKMELGKTPADEVEMIVIPKQVKQWLVGDSGSLFTREYLLNLADLWDDVVEENKAFVEETLRVLKAGTQSKVYLQTGDTEGDEEIIRFALDSKNVSIEGLLEVVRKAKWSWSMSLFNQELITLKECAYMFDVTRDIEQFAKACEKLCQRLGV